MVSWLSRLFGATAPLPARAQDVCWRDVQWLAVDLELTSLDTESAEIVSLGWVAGRGAQINLSSCRHRVVNTNSALNQSPVIHGITESDLKQGCALKSALEELIALAHSHVWVFHHAGLDMPVLANALKRTGLATNDLITVDTLKLAEYQLQKEMGAIPAGSLTLTACRDRFQLPLATAHNALEDAMVTLQLLMGLLHKMDPKQGSRLTDLEHTGALKVWLQTQA